MKKIIIVFVALLIVLSFSSISFASSDCFVERMDLRYEYTWTSGKDYLFKIKVSDQSNGIELDEEGEDFNYRDLRWIYRFETDSPSHTGIINLILKKIGWHNVRIRLDNLQQFKEDAKFEVFIYKDRDLVRYERAIIPLTCDLIVDEHRDVVFGNFRVMKLVKS